MLGPYGSCCGDCLARVESARAVAFTQAVGAEHARPYGSCCGDGRVYGVLTRTHIRSSDGRPLGLPFSLWDELSFVFRGWREPGAHSGERTDRRVCP